MQVELKIKEILNSGCSTDEKVYNICKFMSWDNEKLKNIILKYGTSGEEGRNAIIEEFWAECSNE